jgi:prepilin-type N-terminal cleavage/methylation domain-containing protein
MRKERGFTLIELLIVLAILAILIGIVSLSIGGLRETALKRAMQSEREVVETGINAYITLATPLTTVGDENEARAILATETIGEYLRKTTRYSYTWENAGEPTQKVVVWSLAWDATGFCTATDTLGPTLIACDENDCYKGNTEITTAGLHQVGWDLNGDGDYLDAGETFACTP